MAALSRAFIPAPSNLRDPRRRERVKVIVRETATLRTEQTRVNSRQNHVGIIYRRLQGFYLAITSHMRQGPVREGEWAPKLSIVSLLADVSLV